MDKQETALGRLLQEIKQPEGFEPTLQHQKFVEENLWNQQHSLTHMYSDLGVSGPEGVQLILGMILGALFFGNLILMARRRARKMVVDKASYERAKEYLQGKSETSGSSQREE